MKLSGLITLVWLIFLSSSLPLRAEKTLDVVATFAIIGDIASEIGGDKATIGVLTGQGGDAHVYQPTPKDVERVRSADLILVNGLGLEGWLDRLIDASETKAPVIVASEGVKPLLEEDGREHGAAREEGDHADEDHGGQEHRHGDFDPHAWQDVRNGEIYAGNILKAFIAADPANKDYYQKRADAYLRMLADLDSWVRSEIGKVSETDRKIITSHDAFGYFGAAYGVKFYAPLGVSTDAEPSAAALAALIEQIRDEKIKEIFVENITDPRLIAALAKDAGAIVGGAVYSDSLSPKGGPADSYEKMFRHNVGLFTKAMMKN